MFPEGLLSAPDVSPSESAGRVPSQHRQQSDCYGSGRGEGVGIASSAVGTSLVAAACGRAGRILVAPPRRLRSPGLPHAAVSCERLSLWQHPSPRPRT